MTGTILIVDGVSTNRIVLKVKLSAAFYTVRQAGSGAAAVALAASDRPDLILLGDTLPDIAATDLCRQFRADPDLAGIPVVMIADAAGAEARMAALSAGADEVLTRPVDDLVMLARLRSLLRARDTEQELRLRDGTGRALGFAEDRPEFERPARIALLSGDRVAGARWVQALRGGGRHRMRHMLPAEILRQDGGPPAPDIFVIPLAPGEAETGLALLSDLRSRADTRHSAIIVIVPDADRRAAASALDLGANDLLTASADPAELALRLDTQLHRKRAGDRLRASLDAGMRAAVTDPLTGLYNRRYALPHLARVLARAQETGRPCAVMVADLDHFKQINDCHGHAAGDGVLVEVARRLRENLRAVDLVARIGGEEFLIVMPDTGAGAARTAARRLCRLVGETPIALPGLPGGLGVTISIGVTLSRAARAAGGIQAAPEEELPLILETADRALYGAKSHGRNQVTLHQSAA